MDVREWKQISLILCGAVACLVASAADPAPAPSGEEQTFRVTLTKRVDNAYGDSAYSFRRMSQDPAVHLNYVDLVLNNCGLLHVNAHGGQKNRVARATGKKLSEVDTIPKNGWQTSCFRPEKDAAYVMEIDDGTTRFRVKLRVVEAKADKVTIEWAPLREKVDAAGTAGLCGGEHDCS